MTLADPPLTAGALDCADIQNLSQHGRQLQPAVDFNDVSSSQTIESRKFIAMVFVI